jgi:hypothetical protein
MLEYVVYIIICRRDTLNFIIICNLYLVMVLCFMPFYFLALLALVFFFYCWEKINITMEINGRPEVGISLYQSDLLYRLLFLFSCV